MIEAILYLKENRDLWDINDVCTALKMLKEIEKTARFEARFAALNSSTAIRFRQEQKTPAP